MNGSSHWRPLSQRGSDVANDVILYEGVPPHLYESLIDWVKNWEYLLRGLEYVYLLLRWSRAINDFLDDLADRTLHDRDLLLDVLDAALAFSSTQSSKKQEHELLVKQLDIILSFGGSAWRVPDDGRGLERRVDPAVRKSIEEAITSHGGASEYLTDAWRLNYGRSPDPSNAYNAAIKAVEAAAAPVVSPKNKRTTLGTIIRDIESAPQKWQLAIVRSDGKAELSPLLEPMRLLWNGQTDRHGSGSKPVRITPEAATAAVHLAVMLVHWFQAGLIVKRP